MTRQIKCPCCKTHLHPFDTGFADLKAKCLANGLVHEVITAFDHPGSIGRIARSAVAFTTDYPVTKANGRKRPSRFELILGEPTLDVHTGDYKNYTASRTIHLFFESVEVATHLRRALS